MLPLLRIDMRKNDTSIVDLAMRVNQLDQRLVRSDKPLPSNGERAARLGEARGRSNARRWR